MFSPSDGSARTNQNGIAEIQLQAGGQSGSAQVIARFEVSSSQVITSTPFVFDAIVSGGLAAELSVRLLKHDGTATREVSHFAPAIAEARLIIDDEPAAFQLINFQLGSLGILNPQNGTAMTDVNGIARVDLIAGSEAGAGTLTAVFAPTSNQTVTAAPYVFTTAGDTPVQGDQMAFTISLNMKDQAGNTINQVSNATPGVITALVRNSVGQPVTNGVVSFNSTLGRIQPAFGTALTNANGEASITITAGTIAGAGRVEARYEGVTQGLGFVSAGDEVISPFLLTLALKDNSGSDIRSVSRLQPGVVTAVLTRNGNVVPNQLVTFSLSSEIGQISPVSGTARTDEQGVAEVSLLAGQTAGAGQINAIAVTANGNVSALPFVFDSLGDDRVVAGISLSLLDASGQLVRHVSYASPGSLQALVTENGVPAPFRVVTFTVSGAGEVNPTSGRAMTDADGIARIDLRAGFITGAGEAVAQFTNSEGADIVSNAFAFTSAGDTPVPGTDPDFTINLVLTDTAGTVINEISQATPGVVMATVLDKAGAPMVNQVVNFSSTLGRIQPAFGTALTNSQGEARIRLTAGTIEGAGTVTARYQGVEQNISFRTQGNEIISQYLLTLEMRDGNGGLSRSVSKDNQGELRAVLTFDGIVLSNQLITFELANEVGELIPSIGTARTDDNGLAVIRLFAGAVPGAGMVTATYEAANETVVSLPYVFESTGDQSAETIITAQVVDNIIDNNEVRDVDNANPRKVKVTLTQGGVAAAYKLVTVQAQFSGVINPTSGRAMTDQTGIAYVDLRTGSVPGAGEVIATFTTDAGVVLSSEPFAFQNAGDAPPLGTSPDFSIDLRLISAATNNDTSEVSASSPGQIVATVSDKDGQLVVGKVVSFSTTLGNLRPAVGTALTNNLGEARITLAAGTAEGAGNITAQFEGVSELIGFYTRGDEVDPNQINAAVNFRLLTNCPADFRTLRNPALCTETTSISAEQPGILFIEVTRQGSNTPIEQTLVSAVTTLGTISPRTGTAITDSNGVALLDLVAGRDVGAGEVTVSVVNASRTKAFEIGAVDVEIVVSSSLAANQTLAAGSTALITVDISRNGAPYMPPLGVEFTSGCVQAGLAVIDEAVTSIGGIARSTYRAAGCVGSDLITATVITGGNTVSGFVTVAVSEAALGSIEFLDVSAPVIALKGTGGADRTETSVVRFRLVDANGNPVAGREVEFSLSTSVGGIELAQAAGFTNIDGTVQTIVRSGFVPTPIRVIARSEQTISGATVLVTAPSDVMSVSTGLADQNSFSLSRSAFNVHALDFDGSEVDVTVFLADHFNNPVPDGTAVNFIAEGGSIEPRCITENGRCAVKWRSQNPRPFTAENYANSILAKCDGGRPCPFGIVQNDLSIDRPLGGRATITAYAVGQESFSDLNGNGRFDFGEFYASYDLTEAFTDHNEDGIYGGKSCADPSDPCNPANSKGDEFEEFIDFNSNGSFDVANGLYNGLLCREEDEAAGLCSRELLHIFQNQEIVMSGDEAYFRLVTYAADCSAITGITAVPVRVNSDPTSPEALEVQTDATSRKMCEVTSIDLDSATGAANASLRLFISDIYNNPMPVGTEVLVSLDNGVLVGTNSFVFPNTTSRVPVSLFFAVTREPAGEGNNRSDGFLLISVTSPSGLVSSLSVPVSDDR
ncbi:hypothetical protein GCM10010919_18650 [Alishewanella longhuensis]|uniref:Big-1 domain-containing protein n=1 Tax=Alishewanella longhuensis TaxID=1091037 RepID=A0ABQ3KZF2_9ALTE|nr:hypothetical protein GCM10010919_18650 [Alishewanella longhuensis]